MTTPPRRNASLYIRLSREAGAANLSLAGMEAELRRLADTLGLAVVAVHVDNGKSGAIRDRPELKAWLDDATSGRVDVLLASHTDRLTREGVNAAAVVLDVLEGKDPATGAVVRPPVRLVTADGLDSERDAESFRWRFVIAAEVARAERARIRTRNIATQRRLKAAGRYTGSPVPFGWKVVPAPDGRGKVLAVDPTEATLVRELAERWAAGEAMRSLTRWLNASGLRTRRGGEWTTTTVRKTLATAATRELLTDRELRRAVQARLKPATATATPKHRGGRPTVHLLSGGLARCGGCGSAMNAAAGRYACNALRTGKTCAVSATVTASQLEPYAEEMWLDAQGEANRTRTMPYSDAQDDELDEVAELISGVAAAFATAAPDELAGLATRMADLRAQEAALRAQERSARFSVIRSTGETYGEAWATAGDAENRRALLRETGFTVIVGKARARGVKNVAERCRVEWR